MDGAERLRQARDAEKRIKTFMETHDVLFNGAGEDGLPNVQQAWSIDHLDDGQRKANRATLRGIATILKDYKMIRCEVHGETGAAHSAPKPLARHLSLHPEFDVRTCMDALARARAQACVDALISMGVPPRQLFLTFDGMGGRIAVDFRPEGRLPDDSDEAALLLGVGTSSGPSHPCEDDCEHLQGWLSRRTTMRQWGPAHLPPRHGPCVRSAPLPWAKRDLLDALRKFPRLEASDALREWLRAVSRRAEGGADFEVYVRILCDAPLPRVRTRKPEHEPATEVDWIAKLPGVAPGRGEEPLAHESQHGAREDDGGKRASVRVPAKTAAYEGSAPHTLSDLLHFDCCRLSKLGVCTPKRAKELSDELCALRRVVTSEESLSGNERFPGPLMPDWLFRILGYRGGEGVERAEAITWPHSTETDPDSLREARSRIEELLEDHSIQFNGAGEEGLPHISQAWSVAHLDPEIRQANVETLSSIADVLCEYPHMRCEVHGETGHVRSAPTALASFLELDAELPADVKSAMDSLAMLRAQACVRELVALGVPAGQLFATALGQGGKIAVDFVPEGDMGGEMRFGTVPLRFVPTSKLGLQGWRTLHLALNCHFDPLPHRYCQHSGPCEHREKPSDVDQPAKPSVRSWDGKRADYALSEPLPDEAEQRRSARIHMIGGGERADLRGGNGMSGAELAAATGHGGGPRSAYTEGTRSAFYSSTRTPNPHVGGDGQLGPYAWKTSLLWAEVGFHRGADGAGELLLWESACCLDQVEVSRGRVDAVRYAESVLAALEASEMMWIHGARLDALLPCARSLQSS